MKLRNLPPRIKAAPLARLTPPAAMVERKRGSAGVRDRNAIRMRDFGLCQQCKANGRVSLGAEVDHKKPLWAGGSDDPSNKWLLCAECHDSKTAKEAAQRAAGGLIR